MQSTSNPVFGLRKLLALMVMMCPAVTVFAQGQAASSKSTPSATKSTDAYRDLKSTDGIQFGAYIDTMEFSFGGRPSGTLKRFGLVGKDGELIDLELADTHFTDGRIKTKLFGEIIATSTGPTSLQYQATEDQIRKIQQFLSTQPAKAASSTQSPKAARSYNTMLEAAQAGDSDSVQHFLQKGADINATNSRGASALNIASQTGHANIVQVLLAARANVNAAANDGATSLMLASQEGHADVVQLLLAACFQSFLVNRDCGVL